MNCLFVNPAIVQKPNQEDIPKKKDNLEDILKGKDES